MTSPALSLLQALRRSRHERWMTDLRRRLAQAVDDAEEVPGGPIDVFLFGSRARGDWDGYSDTDLLVVASDQAAADRWVDRLLAAGIASDVMGISACRWQAMDQDPSPYWRAVKAQARPLLTIEL